jgi:hypothetical protein
MKFLIYYGLITKGWSLKMRAKGLEYKKLSVFFITTFVFFLGNLITINRYNLNIEIENKWIITFVFSILIFFYVIKFPMRLKKSKIIILVLWELHVIFIFTAKLIHENFALLEFMLYAFLIPLAFYSTGINKYKVVFISSSIVSVIPFLFILGKGNSMGILICFAGVNLLNLLNIKNIDKKYIYLSIFIISIIIFATGSRTSLLSFFAISIYYISSFLTYKRISQINILKGSLALLFLLCVMYFSYDSIYNLVFEKYNNSNADMLSGRGEIWEGTFTTGVNLFGNGEEYFLHQYYSGDAHNTFVQVLGAYGTLSLILFLLIYFYIIVKTFRYKRNVEYAGFFGIYLILGLAENLYFINSRLIHPNLLFFMYVGFLMNEKGLVKHQKNHSL